MGLLIDYYLWLWVVRLSLQDREKLTAYSR